jgi:RimJ/RimL family protein N-acetyltransferase
MEVNTVLAPQPTITTDLFDLRPPRGSDAGLIGHYAGDARVAKNTRTIPHPLPPGAIETMIARAQAPDRAECRWVLDGTRSGRPEVMGLISLSRVDQGQSELSFWIAPAFWNAGLATSAIQALIDANPHRASAMFAVVMQDNPASARVMTNCGFQYLGDAEAYSVARGANVPTWTYARKLGQQRN